MNEACMLSQSFVRAGVLTARVGLTKDLSENSIEKRIGKFSVHAFYGMSLLWINL
jgi:hypothetical protein